MPFIPYLRNVPLISDLPLRMQSLAIKPCHRRADKIEDYPNKITYLTADNNEDICFLSQYVFYFDSFLPLFGHLFLK